MIKATAQSTYCVEQHAENPHVLPVRSGISAYNSSCIWIARNALIKPDEFKKEY